MNTNSQKLKHFRVKVFRPELFKQNGWIEVLAVDEKEALLMRQYMQDEGLEDS